MTTDYINKLKIKWIREQNILMNKVIKIDQFDDVKFIGGLDISFVKNTNNACVTLAILTFPELKLIRQISEMVVLKVQYIPGFLAFREVEHFMNVLNKLENKYRPQILFVDGNGLLHYRKFGSASHIGVLSGIPTIGVSKNILCVEQFNKKFISQIISKINKKKGEYFKLVGNSGFEYGAILMPLDNTTRPLYVSIGNKISLDTSIRLTLKCCNYRIPEPIRQADLISRAYIRNIIL